jgi:hypothetical protein
MAVAMPEDCLTAIRNWEYWDEIQIGAEIEYSMTREEFDELLPEYQRFMALVAQGYTQLGMFSSGVDKIWHAHILNTLLYEQFCTQIYGKMIHHLPNTRKSQEHSEGCITNCSKTNCSHLESLNDIVDPATIARQFRDAYRVAYGEYPGDVWNLPVAE